MVPGFPGDEAGAQRSLASLAYSDHDSVARQCGGEINHPRIETWERENVKVKVHDYLF